MVVWGIIRFYHKLTAVTIKGIQSNDTHRHCCRYLCLMNKTFLISFTEVCRKINANESVYVVYTSLI